MPATDPAAPVHPLPGAVRRLPRQPGRVAALVCVVGVLLTVLATYATAKVDDNTEKRLLQVQSKQVSEVLATTIQVIQNSLSTALTVQPAAGSRETEAFSKAMTASVGPKRLFVSASLWKRRGDRLVRLATVGVKPALGAQQSAAQTFLTKAFTSKTFVVLPVTSGAQRRIAYAMADPRTGYVVYSDRAIPANRRSPVDSNSAFADLHYAIYLGPTKTLDALSTTDVALSSLPLTGRVSTVTVPFGDSVLTVATSPRHHLGADLSKWLPLILLLSGLLLTLIAARAGQQLVRRRLKAEDDAAVVTALYDEVEALYGQERVLSERLQRALLPPVIPAVPQLEVAVEYVAGAHGVDIGGDWYSMLALDDDHFAFVVGDVSGRGIDAVAVMARARFTLRAYLLRGDSPEIALEMCSHQFDIVADGHMATTVVGIGNCRTGEITVANAGHPTPLLLTDDGAHYVETATGPPLGIGPTTYKPTTFTMPPGSTLFCFTDGLIERREEGIDAGMARLATTVQDAVTQPVDELVPHTVRALRSDDAEDDIAVLALRWVPES